MGGKRERDHSYSHGATTVRALHLPFVLTLLEYKAGPDWKIAVEVGVDTGRGGLWVSLPDIHFLRKKGAFPPARGSTKNNNNMQPSPPHSSYSGPNQTATTSSCVTCIMVLSQRRKASLCTQLMHITTQPRIFNSFSFTLGNQWINSHS